MDSFHDTFQRGTSFSLQEKEGVLLYLMGIQVCFGKKCMLFPCCRAASVSEWQRGDSILMCDLF